MGRKAKPKAKRSSSRKASHRKPVAEADTLEALDALQDMLDGEEEEELLRSQEHMQQRIRRASNAETAQSFTKIAAAVARHKDKDDTGHSAEPFADIAALPAARAAARAAAESAQGRFVTEEQWTQLVNELNQRRAEARDLLKRIKDYRSIIDASSNGAIEREPSRPLRRLLSGSLGTALKPGHRPSISTNSSTSSPVSSESLPLSVESAAQLIEHKKRPSVIHLDSSAGELW